MAGFMEHNVPCPKCNKNTGTLDLGKSYEDFYCNNKECNYSHSIDFNKIKDKETK